MPAALANGAWCKVNLISRPRLCRRSVFFQAVPISVYCQIEFDLKTGLDRTVSMLLDFPEGKMAQLLTGYGLNYRSRYSALRAKGRLEASRRFVVPLEMKTDVILETAAGSETLSVPPADQFKPMIKNFCDLLKQPVTSQTTFQEKLLCQHTVMEAAWHSHLERRTVLLSEVTP